MSSIILKMVGPGVTEGSSDHIRTTFGGFYAFAETEDGQKSLPFSASVAASTTTTKVVYPEHEFIAFSKTIPTSVVTASNSVVVPSYTIPVLLVGRDNAIKNDEHWKSIMMGTTYGSSSYEPIISPISVADNNFSVEIPYELLSLKNVVGEYYGDYKYITQGYTYNYHHTAYEQGVKDRAIYTLPNLYLLNAAFTEDTSGVHEDLINFINLEGETEANSYELKTLFESKLFKYPPSAESDETFTGAKKNRHWDEQYNYKTYLDLYNDTSLSASTRQETATFQNVIYDRDFVELDAAINLYSVPYYMDMSWSTSSLGTIGEKLKSNDAQYMFMKMIKSEFVDNRTRLSRWSTHTQYTTVSASNSTFEDREDVLNGSYYYFDLLPQCAAYLTRADQPGSTFAFLTNDILERKILTDHTGIYRQIKKSRMMNFFSEMVEHIDTTYSKKDVLEKGVERTSLSGLLDDAQSVKPSEILGYRVEKVGGTPVGEARSLRVLSNSYIFNDGLPATGEDDNFHFYDTQVKYGNEYKYNIYQYMAVVGYRYRHGDYEITRQIGSSSTDTYGSDTHCLEFHSPNSSLASVSDRPEGGAGGVYTPLSGSGADQNPYANSAQVLSDYQYLCMFNYTIEPYVRIVEIPLSSKRLSVLDHPPRAVEVVPYQKKDDSQTIGFYVKYESFVPQPYPNPIGATEELFKETYLNSNNLTSTEDVTHLSTKPIGVQVFRINEKPTSYNDFANNLIATVPLRDATYEFPFTNCFYEERIQTDQKYYYLFRFINQHSMPGHLSPVIEAELVSNDSYKYSLFDIVGPSDITDVISVDAPSKPFKKLLQLIPAPAQVILDDSTVDYAEAAADQVANFVVGNANEKVWDKTFKVRLTSKKTGEKLDINVTYNLTTE